VTCTRIWWCSHWMNILRVTVFKVWNLYYLSAYMQMASQYVDFKTSFIRQCKLFRIKRKIIVSHYLRRQDEEQQSIYVATVERYIVSVEHTTRYFWLQLSWPTYNVEKTFKNWLFKRYRKLCWMWRLCKGNCSFSLLHTILYFPSKVLVT
jgi:hypothetical protein